MFIQLLKIRYIAAVIVAVAVLDSLSFLVLGTKSAVHGYKQLLGFHGPSPGRPGLELLHSLDFLFVSLVFLILGLSIAKLFLLGPSDVDDATLPSWLRLNSIGEMKVLLWETSLVTMLVVSLSEMTANLETRERDWTLLLTPAAILLLAISLYFIKKKE
ncbi:MAG TPA: YqhA family protein [Polyangia bacterium]|nr:YqhA family protein [Polyangia bacterium]